MKKLISIALISLPLAFRAQAQWVVFDPTAQMQEIIDTAQQIAQFVTMVENQVTQIETLANQLSEFKHYEDLFGNPASVRLPTISGLNTDLLRTEVGRNLDDLLAIADGNYALTYNGSGIFQTVGQTFETPGGQTITRPAEVYKPYAAVSRAADNYSTVAKDAATRRAAIKNRIAQTAAQLQSATTDAEVQKLQGVLTGLSADLNSTDAEVNQALASTLVQDIQNRNDERKQQQALAERHNAEFHEAIGNCAATFPLLTDPVVFPTP